MPVAPFHRPAFRTRAYWEALEDIADDFVDVGATQHHRPGKDAGATLKRLLSYGYGPASLFDLCTLLLLALARAAQHPSGAGRPDPIKILPIRNTEPSASGAASPVAAQDLKRGPVTVATHPTERQIQRVRELEAAVAEALQIAPDHPRARSTARRTLMTQGATARDATTIYGIVCELVTTFTSHTDDVPTTR